MSMKAIYWRGVVVLGGRYEDHYDIFPRLRNRLAANLGLSIASVEKKMAEDADAERLLFGYLYYDYSLENTFLFESAAREYLTTDYRGGAHAIRVTLTPEQMAFWKTGRWS